MPLHTHTHTTLPPPPHTHPPALQIYGFGAECRRISSSLGKFCPLHRCSLELFEWLPVAAVVSNAVLVLHGGIGDGLWSLQQLREARRPISDEILDVSAVASVWVWCFGCSGVCGCHVLRGFAALLSRLLFAGRRFEPNFG
jgi:hypothetical protein